MLNFCAFLRLIYVFIVLVKWPPIGNIAAHSAYELLI